MSAIIIRQTCVAVLCLLVCAQALSGERDPALAGYFSAPLQIATASGEQHALVVYLAVTPQQRAHGLMFVRELPDHYGMLFVHERAHRASMWMKNTVLPLDMLFIRADGTIANIVSHTIPGSLESISATEPVTGVLELNAGTAQRLKLAPGDRVIYRAFDQTVGNTD